MNRSYSKIRHIQESNQRLEKRLISERVIRKQVNEVITTTTTTVAVAEQPYKLQEVEIDRHGASTIKFLKEGTFYEFKSKMTFNASCYAGFYRISEKNLPNGCILTLQRPNQTITCDTNGCKVVTT
jgi:N-methylhydantoinase B/oxoprolinase/acetone carboxylase alpha subunit